MRTLYILSVYILIFTISASHLCQAASVPGLESMLKHSFSQRECLMCRFSVGLVNYSLKTQRGAERVNRIADNFCSIAKIESPAVCSQVTKLFNHEIIKVLSYGIVLPDQVCGYLSNNTCGHYHNPMGDWEVNLNASLHLDPEEISKIHAAQQALKDQAYQKPYRVIHISDTHIDLRYKENSVAVCDEPLCCRLNSKPDTNKTNANTKAGYWGTYGACDVPLRTLESALKVLNTTMESTNDIDYIIWTGDIQPHDVWSQNQTTATETYDAVFRKIFEYLPNARIFPTFGNHEMIPVDSFSPSNLLNIAKDDSPEWLYRKMDSFWSRWLPQETVATITKDGFYAASVRPGLKIVSLNTNFCHNKNFWLYINSTDPGNQLQWLIHELQISELEHEQVHIVGHIPPGVGDCLKVWSKNYNRIVRRFAKTITGQFFGHTHNSEFEIYYDQNSVSYDEDPKSKTWKPISVGFIGPSITTFIDLNPSFRIYSVDPSKNYMPVDFETYFMNLTKANIEGQQEPEWKSTGTFSQVFKIGDISPQSLHNLMIDLSKDFAMANMDTKDATSLEQLVKKAQAGSLDGNLFKLYRMFNSYSDYYNKSRFDQLHSQEIRRFLCGFFSSQAHDVVACNHFVKEI